jgi:hypothetical protein
VIRGDVDAHATSLRAACDTILFAGGVNIILATDASGVLLAHDGTMTQSLLARAVAETSTPRAAAPTPSEVLPASTAVFMVLAVAALVGGFTPIGERILPESLSSMANSSGPWAMVVFTSVYLSRFTGWRAAVLAVSAFVVMDGCFYVVFDFLGGYYAHHYLMFWVVVAICVGPLVGLCASWLRSPRKTLQEIAVAAPAAILVGEGVFMLVRLPGVSVFDSVLSIVVGAVAFGLLAVLLLREPRRIAVSLALSAVGAQVFVGIYGLLPLVLNKVVP